VTTGDPTARVIAAERERRRRARARDSLLDFVQVTSPDTYTPGWLHVEITRRLEKFSADVAAGRSPRLMICCPPRHGKTHIVSQRFPVWHMARYPGSEIVCASYGSELAEDNSRAARRIAADPATLEVFPALRPTAKRKGPRHGRHDEIDRVGHWRVPNGSSYFATGVGGALTGLGASVLVLDDVIKGRAEAESQTIRDSIWHWYADVARTRLAPGGGILSMGTRWHQLDPLGRLLAAEAEGGEKWELVIYPAIAEQDEPHRRAGEPLHPERYPLAELEQLRKTLGSRSFASLYQQRPAPAGGSTFKDAWFQRRYNFDAQRAPFDEIAIDVDATFKGGSGTDFVVFQAWGRRGWTEYYLLDQVRRRMTYVECKSALRAFVRKWHRCREIAIEEKANGAALISDLGGEIPGLVPVNPTASKEARAEISATAFEAGNVLLPASAPWVDEYIDEHLGFPNAAHDDQVDATSQRMIRWLEKARKPDPNASLRFLDALSDGGPLGRWLGRR
jgi:predicted phage terminase large subunit-like protein